MTVNYDELLRACCAKEASRYSVTEPWVAGGFRIASDGRVLVRLPTTAADSKPPKGVMYPPTDDVLKGVFVDDGVACPDPGPERVAECERCRGLGIARCDLDHEHDCPDCGGRGQLVEGFPIEIGHTGVFIKDEHARLLCRFRAVMFVARHQDPKTRVIKWTVGEAEGRVMPTVEPIGIGGRVKPGGKYVCPCGARHMRGPCMGGVYRCLKCGSLNKPSRLAGGVG